MGNPLLMNALDGKKPNNAFMISTIDYHEKVFIAATRQNDGKTTVSLGLFNALRNSDPSIQYMKPVGQQYVETDGKKIDKDAILFNEHLT